MTRLLTLVFLMMLVACGGRQSTLMQNNQAEAQVDTAKAEALSSEAKALWAERGTLEKADAAIAKWHEAAKADPSNPLYHRELTYAYYFLNNVHYRWTDNKEKVRTNYEAGVASAEQAPALANPAFAGQIKAGPDTDAVWKKKGGRDPPNRRPFHELPEKFRVTQLNLRRSTGRGRRKAV